MGEERPASAVGVVGVTSARPWMQAVLTALAVVAAVVAAVGLLSIGPMRDARYDGLAALDAADVTTTRIELAWLHYDLLLDQLIAEADGTELAPAVIERYTSRRDERLGRLDTLAANDGDAGDTATRLLDVHDDAVRSGDGPLDLDELYRVHVETMPFDASGWAADALQAEIDAATVATLPQLVLTDAVALTVADAPSPPPSWAAGFVESTVDVVITTPGWLGRDGDRPLEDPAIFRPSSDSADDLPAFTRQLASVEDDLRTVWRYDQWLIEGRGEGEAPPTDVDELAAATERVVDGLRSATIESLADARSEVEAAHPSTTAIVVRLALSVTAAVVALVLAGIGVVQGSRRRRQLSEVVYTDALTEIRNRRFLDEEVEQRCARRGQHHVVAMIDLDRFKLVNDTWGHDAGDRLLQVMAQRLAAVADAFGAPEGASGAAVRVGGDEFALTLHLPHPPDLPHVERSIRAVGGSIDVGVGEPVELAFSVGFATAVGPADLASLVRSADLAAYDDKEQRRRAPGSAPVVTDLVDVDLSGT